MTICNINIIIKSNGKGQNANNANWGNDNNFCYEGTLYNFLRISYDSSKFKHIVEGSSYEHINVKVTGSKFLGLYLKKRCQKQSDKVTVNITSVTHDEEWFEKALSILPTGKNFFIYQKNCNRFLDTIFDGNQHGLNLFKKLFNISEIDSVSGNEGGGTSTIPHYLFLLPRGEWQNLPTQKSYISFGEVSNENEADISDVSNGPYCHWNLRINELQETISAYLLDCFVFPEIDRVLDQKLKEGVFFDKIEDVCTLFALRENEKSYLATLENTNVIVGRKNRIKIYECFTGSISADVPKTDSVVIQDPSAESSLDKHPEKGTIEFGTSNFGLITKKFQLSIANWPELKAVLIKGTGKNNNQWKLYKPDKPVDLTVLGDGSIRDLQVKNFDHTQPNDYIINDDEKRKIQITASYYDMPKDNSISPEKIEIYKGDKKIKEVAPSNEELSTYKYIFFVEFPGCDVGRYKIEIRGSRSEKSLCFFLKVRDPNVVPDDLIVEDFTICKVCKKDAVLSNEKLQISKVGAKIVVKYPGNVETIGFKPRYISRGHENEEFGGNLELRWQLYGSPAECLPLTRNSQEQVTICPNLMQHIKIISVKDVIKETKEITIVFKKQMHPCLLLALGSLVLTIVNLCIHCFVWYGLPLVLLIIYFLPLFLNLHYFLKFSLKIYSKEQLMANSVWIITTLFSIFVILYSLQEEMHL